MLDERVPRRLWLVSGLPERPAAACCCQPMRLSEAMAQVSLLQDERFAGLQWTFVRIRYSAFTVDNRYRLDYWGEPWAIDAPAAEQNLSRRLRTATAIEVNDPIVLTLDDPKLWDQGWIYIVEPGNLRLRDDEVSILREFLLRGGTATFDDFHGPYEWDNFADEMRRVFPDRQIVDLEPPHPIYTSFYNITAYPQTPGLGSFFAGRTWEKGGFVPRSARHSGRSRPADGARKLEHRHGRRRRVVECRRVSRLSEVHRRRLPDVHQRDHLQPDPLGAIHALTD